MELKPISLLIDVIESLSSLLPIINLPSTSEITDVISGELLF